uniref:Uncharacterized protein n=1 Tax=Anopheles dirus TaxID=7168 RepID=A0A182NVV5_9DIPT
MLKRTRAREPAAGRSHSKRILVRNSRARNHTGQARGQKPDILAWAFRFDTAIFIYRTLPDRLLLPLACLLHYCSALVYLLLQEQLQDYFPCRYRFFRGCVH